MPGGGTKDPQFDAPKSLVSGTLGDCKNASIARSAPESNYAAPTAHGGPISSLRRIFSRLVRAMNPFATRASSINCPWLEDMVHQLNKPETPRSYAALQAKIDGQPVLLLEVRPCPLLCLVSPMNSGPDGISSPSLSRCVTRHHQPSPMLILSGSEDLYAFIPSLRRYQPVSSLARRSQTAGMDFHPGRLSVGLRCKPDADEG